MCSYNCIGVLRTEYIDTINTSLQSRHIDRDGVPNHQPHDCLLNRLFRHRWQKNIKAPRHWSLKSMAGETLPTFPAHAQPAIYVSGKRPIASQVKLTVISYNYLSSIGPVIQRQPAIRGRLNQIPFVLRDSRKSLSLETLSISASLGMDQTTISHLQFVS